MLYTISGFSRGASTGIDFSNTVLQQGVPGTNIPPEMVYIDKMLLFDTVGSYFLPGNNVNLTTSNQVGNIYHAISSDENILIKIRTLY